MGKSFYWGTETRLYYGAMTFSAQLSADPTAYGISPEQASAYAAVVAVWVAAYEEARVPSQRTRSRVIAKNDAKRQILTATANLAKIISGTPTVTDEQKCNLGLSIRSTSRTAGAPGTPSNFTVELSAIGEITIKWKCSNPTAGTMYEVRRGIGDAIDRNETAYLATVGKKRFTDDTVPGRLVARDVPRPRGPLDSEGHVGIVQRKLRRETGLGAAIGGEARSVNWIVNADSSSDVV